MTRRCTARSKRSGRRCRRAPILGGSVCASHGGRAPQVRAAADARLRALIDPAIDALARALRTRDWPAVVRAARDVLDRTGTRENVVSVEQMRAYVAAVGQVVVRHVPDNETRLAVVADLQALSRGIGIDDLAIQAPTKDTIDRLLRQPRLRAEIERRLLARALPAAAADEPDEIVL